MPVRFKDLAGRNVVIWGAGREARAAHEELRRRGIPGLLAVTGGGPVPTDLTAIAAVGTAALERLKGADVIIKSPGVPRTCPEFRCIRELAIPVTSLTDLWLSANAARVLAVTGTKGKSTTSSLVHHLLVSIGVPASLVGNGGTPVTYGDTTGAQVAVTEVSSYQAADLTCSPRVAVVTSLYSEHLPWHGGYDEYVDDKLNMITYGPELVVIPDLDSNVAVLVRTRLGARSQLVVPDSLGITWSDVGISWEGVGSLDPDQIPIQGRHNYANIALALAVVVSGFKMLGDNRRGLLAAVESFAPLRHRLETVPSNDGRRWVDDSLATAPEAVVAALETFPDSRVALILGGADRGLSFEPLTTYLSTRSSHASVDVVAVGPAGARWMASGGPSSTLAPSFAAAMRLVRTELDTAEIVLLSPAAPSFDEFASYEQRAGAFRVAASGHPTGETIQ